MHDLPLITTIAAAFASAWVLGLVTQWMRLSPIVGYLAAGIVIGPYTPGFIGDKEIAHQLAEVGVILLMFGVGLHFHLKDLMAVKGVAIPGAIGQVLVATASCIFAFSLIGMPLKESIVVGLALSVASTVVLMRVLMDANVMHTPEGHVAVGWLLVEDLLTVIVLVIIPTIGTPQGTEHVATDTHWMVPIAMALVKLSVLLAIVMLFGMRIIPWALEKVARLRSRELFTLTVLVFSISVAAGAYAVFGASMALGAFLAGMMVAQSPVSHQAAADALPLRDAFAVIFFVSVGMIFNPAVLITQPALMIIALAIVLIVKPLAALVIVALTGWSVRTALTVALALAQVGEFSFILSEVGKSYGLISEASHSMLVAAAMLSITINPLIFRKLPDVERLLQRSPWLWKLLNYRSDRRIRSLNQSVASAVSQSAAAEERLAVVIGYGPVGRSVNRLLRDAGMKTVIIDMNMDAVNETNRSGQPAIYGDGSREAILEQAGVGHASHLVITLPQSSGAGVIISAAKNLNPKIRILVRARYLGERKHLEEAGASAAVFEEGEAAVALARLVLADFGASRDMVERTVRDLRLRLLLDNLSNLSNQNVQHLMVPWPRVKCLTNTLTLEQVRRQVAEEHFSRWPVIDAATGKPTGYLLAKDLVSESSSGTEWVRLVRPLSTVGVDLDIQSLLNRLQEEGSTLCLVERFGRPVGIITMEDILEQLIGRIEDEYPRAADISIPESLKAGGVKIELFAETPEEAIQELAAVIPPSVLPKGALVAENAIERERQFSTDVGMGIAIPHARCAGLKKPVIAFGRSNHGIIFNAQSREPVRFVFLIVTPEEKPEMQVIMLGKIARIMADPQVAQQLQEATTSMEVFDILGR
ncbi:cation:proton antiporter [Planctomicrobium sp. SH661]|uniref:cation:proton antiporter domain-containing protein n=1 Tax=Planctomicrobium sp. SH661 TaxID=3448124 RepID=UPI003F5B6EB8